MKRPRLYGTLSVLTAILTIPAKEVQAGLFGTKDDDDSTDETASHEVSFQGAHKGEHFTMQVEHDHTFKCFDDEAELQAAVDGYTAYNHIDMTMAETYGWPIGNWCVSKVTDFSDLFADRTIFNEDIGMWDTRQVTDMTAVFQNALDFDQDISQWDTTKVTSMSRYVLGRLVCFFLLEKNIRISSHPIAFSFSQNIRFFNSMFAAAKSFNQDISHWKVGNLHTTSYMFLHALAFNSDISDWKMPLNTDMERMFRDTRQFAYKEQVQAKWNLLTTQEDAENGQSVINTKRMMIDCGEF